MTTLLTPGATITRRPRYAVAVRERLRELILDGGWARPASIAVIALSAVLYVWSLTLNGYANTYYAAAAVAASKDWTAWFFGSIDASNFITVDKPPLSTMVMGLSVRIFGLSSWSILLPEALMGVGSVFVLFRAVRRSFVAAAGIIAALVLAVTPVAALMFRFDNPDALLTLLLVSAAWVLLRALDDARLRWVVLAGALVGLGFLTKYLQAYLVLPAFFFTYLLAASDTWRRRGLGLLVAGMSVLLASGWWVAVVELTPAGLRPYIGGSTNNSVLDLIFGYDGLGRIFGASGSPCAGAAQGGGIGFGGTAGILRLFNSEFAGQIAWLLPFAGIALVSGLWLRRRAPRTDPKRAGYLLWGLWLAVHVIVFSFMSGIIHTYYAVVMAPAIGALVGAGTVELWRWRQRSVVGGMVLAAGILVTALLANQLLAGSTGAYPALGVVILIAGIAVALFAAVPIGRRMPRLSMVAAALGLVVLLAAPVASTLYTVNTAYAGSIVTAGPALAALSSSGTTAGGGTFGAGAGLGQSRPTAGGPGTGGPGTGTQNMPLANPGGQTAPGGIGGSIGGGNGDATADTALVDYLVANRGSAAWIVAVSGSGTAASIELSSGEPVMAMGGFNGGDPAPTLEQLQAYVASGQLRYILLGGQGGGPNDSASAISSWVTANGTAVEYGGSGGTLYDLSGTAVANP